MAKHLSPTAFIAVPDVLWHGSDVESPDLDTPSILGTHFGSMVAAQQRLADTRRGAKSWVKPYRLTIERPLELPDLGVWSFQSITRELGLLKLMTPLQADAAYEGRNRSDADGWEVVRNVLRSAGYDAIVYTNAVEDPGSVSWIVLDGKQATVLEQAREDDARDDVRDSNVQRADRQCS